MKTFTDQTGHKIILRDTPRRIISLVPSQTELLVDLGLKDRLVGVTKFCIHPQTLRKEVATIGGTKNFNFERIASLKPDLIIGNKEENYKEGIERLRVKHPVWISDIFNLTDAYSMMAGVGELTETTQQVGVLIRKIKNEFNALKPLKSIRVAYVIWKEPLMAAASSTFIDHMLQVCGFENVYADRQRYPETSLREMSEKKPDIVFLSSEPYPFKEKHIEEFRNKGLSAKMLCVDGEMFSWYGSRLALAPVYFQELVNSL